MPNQLVVRRILTYRGDREWLEKTLRSSIHGTKFINSGNCSISAVTMDEFPVAVGPTLLESLQKELELGKKYYPDNDDERDGYLDGVQACIDLFLEFLKDG